MKILIVTNHFYPEVFRVNDVAFALAKKGHQVSVLTGIPDYPQGHYFAGYGVFKKSRETVQGVKVIRVPIISRGQGRPFRLMLNYLTYLLSASLWALTTVFRNKYDCILVHETSPVTVGIPAVIIKKIQKIPLYFWVLDLWPESLTAGGGITNPTLLSIFKRIVVYLYENSDKILISSQGFVESITEKGDFGDKVVYFPNWGEEVFENGIMIDGLPSLPAGFKIMYAGNIGEAQGFETIMEAALKLRDNNTIKWIFIGDGRKRNYIEEFVEQNSLENSVFLLGHYPIKMMPAFFQEADVLLVSLKDEMLFNITVPAKLQAYMAASKPVCAVLNGEGAAIVREARNGCVVPAGDVDELVHQIIELSELPREELECLGKSGKAYYNQHFRKDVCLEHLYNIINCK